MLRYTHILNDDGHGTIAWLLHRKKEKGGCRIVDCRRLLLQIGPQRGRGRARIRGSLTRVQDGRRHDSLRVVGNDKSCRTRQGYPCPCRRCQGGVMVVVVFFVSWISIHTYVHTCSRAGR